MPAVVSSFVTPGMVLTRESKALPRGRVMKISLVMTWPLVVLLTSIMGAWPTTVTCSLMAACSSVTFKARVWENSRLMSFLTRVLNPASEKVMSYVPDGRAMIR